jgi:hypothetical protein
MHVIGGLGARVRRVLGAGRRWRGGPRWGVVAQVREPLELLIPFVAHHLGAGASRVTLFMDDPDDPAIPVLEGIPGVDVVPCDAAHWSLIPGGRPARKLDRQVANFTFAHAESDLDWIAHIDADEYIVAPGGVRRLLRRLGARDGWINLPPLERVWTESDTRDTLFGGHLRSALPGGVREVREIFGTGMPQLEPSGLAGHHGGKVLAPVGADLTFRMHRAQGPDGEARIPPSEVGEIALVHFEALTQKHWTLKHLRQGLAILEGAQSFRPARRAVTLEIVHAPDPLAEAARQFERTYVLSDPVASRLRAGGHLRNMPIDPARAAARHLPSMPVDLSAAHLDREIDPILADTLEEVLARRDGTAPGTGGAGEGRPEPVCAGQIDSETGATG